MKIAEFMALQTLPLRQRLESLFAEFPPDAPVLSTTIAPGYCILEQDEAARSVFILVSGSCRSMIHQSDSKVHAFTEFHAIELFGEYEVIAEMPRYLADVRAVTECVFLSVAAQDYKLWMSRDSNLMWSRTQSIVRTLLGQTFEGRSSLYLSSTERLQQFLLQYVSRHRPQEDGRVRVNKTHAAISEEIGFSLRTVNRAINQLAAQGVVSLHRGKMLVSPEQIEALKALVGAVDESW